MNATTNDNPEAKKEWKLWATQKVWFVPISAHSFQLLNAEKYHLISFLSYKDLEEQLHTRPFQDFKPTLQQVHNPCFMNMFLKPSHWKMWAQKKENKFFDFAYRISDTCELIFFYLLNINWERDPFIKRSPRYLDLYPRSLLGDHRDLLKFAHIHWQPESEVKQNRLKLKQTILLQKFLRVKKTTSAQRWK